MSEKVECPICGKVVALQGLNLHTQRAHPDEYKITGFAKIKEDATIAMEEKKEHEEQEPEPGPPLRPPPSDTAVDSIDDVPIKETIEPMPNIPDKPLVKANEVDRGIGTWYAKTAQKLYFNPSPMTLAIINQFAGRMNPSDFVNASVAYYAKTKFGIEPAIIKTGGGEAMSLMGDVKDVEFDRLLKLATVTKEMNMSFNQNTPLIQAMSMMKEKVNKGMNMSQFAKEMITVMLLSKTMEGM
jgi:hypothetical protein